MGRLRAAFGAALAVALVAFLAATQLALPSPDDVRAAGSDLVPDRSDESRLGESTGHPVIVGHGFFVVADFRASELDHDQLTNAFREQAETQGWTTIEDFASELRNGLELSRGVLTAQARFWAIEEGGRPTRQSRGSVRVETDGQSAIQTIVLWALAGAIAGAVAGWLLTRRHSAGGALAAQ